MKTAEFRSIKKGDLLTHKVYGLCEVVDFVVWHDASNDPVLMPQTQEGKELLLRHSGMKDAPFLETNKNFVESSSGNKINPSIEEDILKFVEYETRERKVLFWGSDHTIKPQLIKEIEGDGLQVVWFQSFDHRPNYYVLRIDSSHDIASDDFDEGILLQMVEREFLNVDDFKEIEINGKEIYVHVDDLDFDGRLLAPVEYALIKEEEDLDFPMLSWSGGSWGTCGNFKDVNYCRILRKLLSLLIACRKNNNPESFERVLECGLKIPEAIRCVILSKIQEANGIDFGASDDYHYWKVDEKDYASEENYIKAWYKPRLKAIRKTMEFLK
ncbi:MAG: hypothetical protein LBP83_02045 [Dysgonamonadaceae bacterium]|jgi:hypothetical protein|nr:hypothetical protein [Dysgonamonadaceae bacterium]